MPDAVGRKAALDRIQQNIERHGHHTYLVSGGCDPRFAYTIGLSGSINKELVLAGAAMYSANDVLEIVDSVASRLKASPENLSVTLPQHGVFALRTIHQSWVSQMMLAALVYYDATDIPASQIVPHEAHWTIDIPDLSRCWDAATEPIWRWLQEPWPYSVPSNSTVITNLRALRGERITEAVRWEDDYWELFAGPGPDVLDSDGRAVPLGTLIGADRSLVPILELALGEGVWRDATSDWHPWRRKDRSG